MRKLLLVSEASRRWFHARVRSSSDDLTSFNAAVHWMTTDLAGGGPKAFDIKIQFSQPFAYDPSKGALLIDYESFGPISGGVIVDTHGHGDPTIGWGGGISTVNLVTQFEITPIPELSAALMMFAALTGSLFGFAEVHRREMRV